MSKKYKKGRLEVITGPMFAGKTEELIRRARRLYYAKKKFLIFKPQLDDRYSDEYIVSHNAAKEKSININSSAAIVQYITDDVYAVIVDEAQFFDDNLPEVLNNLADRGLLCIAAGLDKDFRGEPFGVMPTLLAFAERVTKLTAICAVSGEDATRTQRLINGKPAYYDDPIILIGASESYEPRSREHHEVPRK